MPTYGNFYVYDLLIFQLFVLHNLQIWVDTAMALHQGDGGVKISGLSHGDLF